MSEKDFEFISDKWYHIQCHCTAYYCYDYKFDDIQVFSDKKRNIFRLEKVYRMDNGQIVALIHEFSGRSWIINADVFSKCFVYVGDEGRAMGYIGVKKQ